MPNPGSPLKRINILYDKCLGLLEKEVAHLTSLAITSKLPTSPAKDLRDIVKLLADMKEAQTAIVRDKAAEAERKVKAAGEAELLKALIQPVEDK